MGGGGSFRASPLALAIALVFMLTIVPVAPAEAVAVDATDVFIDFEDGAAGGLETYGGASAVISTEQAFSGDSSLLVQTGNDGAAGVHLDVTQNITPDMWHEVSFWVLMKTTDYGFINLHTELRVISPEDGWQVLPITFGGLSQDDGWTKFRGFFYYDSEKHDLSDVSILIEDNNPGSEYYIDDVSFMLSEINQNIIDSRRLPSLYQAYEDYFMLGNVHKIRPFDVDSPDPNFLPLLRHHFNMFTSGAHSWSTAPERGVFDFSIPDKNMEILESVGFTIHGHVLVYRLEHADWLTNNEDGSYLTRAEAIENMEWYINGVAGRYQGRFHSWEVVNEIIGNLATGVYFYSDEQGYGSPWYMAFENGADRSAGESGVDHVEYAFRFARAADPTAILYYNETGEELPQMADFMYETVKRINDKWLAEGNDRLLIEGIGMQGHYTLDTEIEDVRRSIQMFADLGVKISISELGLRVFDYTEEITEPTEELFHRQATMYAELFQLFKEYSDVIERVTIYGFYDSSSWYNFVDPRGGFHSRPAFPRYPLLFNDDFAPKLAYFAVIDPEGYLAGDFDTPEKIAAWLEANMLPEVAPEDDAVTDNEPDAPAPPPATTPPSDSPSQDEHNAVTQDTDPEDGGNTVLWIVLGVVGVVGVAVAVVLVVKKKK